MEHLLLLVNKPGGLILDPFAGSGSTLVAAKRLGITCLGIEIDEDYYNIAVRRLNEAKAVKLFTSNSCVIK